MQNDKGELIKIPTGISGFDDLVNGGLPKGRITLVSGSSGSGKTVFAMQFLYMGIVNFNEAGVFITFEEKPEDIIKNCSSFGWDLKPLINSKMLIFIDASPTHEENVEAGIYDLEGLLVRIKYAINSVNAQRMSIDSISALFPQYNDIGTIRWELNRITNEIRKFGIATVLTAETDEAKKIERFGIEHFISDNVILLHSNIEKEQRFRSMEILKFRGSSHSNEDTPFIIGSEGIKIFPKPNHKIPEVLTTQKIRTGVKGLDGMISGGFYELSTTLLLGPSGIGKTTVGMQFLLQGAIEKQKGLLILYEETIEQLTRNAEAFGWVEWGQNITNGMIKILHLYPEEVLSEEHYTIIKNEIDQFKPNRVVLDSLTTLEITYKPEKYFELVTGLNSYFKREKITSIFIYTSSTFLELKSVTDSRLSIFTDNIIILKYFELEGTMKKLITLLKVRGTNHDKDIREFTITNNGAVVGESFKNVRGLLSANAEFIISPSSIMKRIYALREQLERKEISQIEFEQRYKELQTLLDSSN